MGPTGGLSAYPSDSAGSVLKTESQFHLGLIAKQAIFYLTVSEKQDLALQLDSALIQGWDGHTEHLKITSLQTKPADGEDLAKSVNCCVSVRVVSHG